MSDQSSVNETGAFNCSKMRLTKENPNLTGIHVTYYSRYPNILGKSTQLSTFISCCYKYTFEISLIVIAQRKRGRWRESKPLPW